MLGAEVEVDAPAVRGPTSGLAGGVALGALVVAGLAVGLLLAELLVRFVSPQLTYRYPRGLFVNDAECVYRLAPGFSGRMRTPEYTTTIRINADGLRADHELAARTPGVRRVLVLGDSFTMGHSVEQTETFEEVAARRLDAAGHGHVEILNAGVAGWSTREELAWLRSRGLGLAPDVVVLGLFVGNDIVDNARARTFSVRDGYLNQGVPAPGLLPISLRTFLARRSQLYALLAPVQRRLRGLPVTNGPDPLMIYGDGAGTAALWNTTEELIGAFVSTAHARGIPVALVIMPELIQIDGARWSSATKDRPGLDPLLPDRRLAEIATRLGVPLLDLEPALRAAGTTEPLYFPLDSHWTVAGNRVVGEALARFLAGR
jgi:hypothetical protein